MHHASTAILKSHFKVLSGIFINFKSYGQKQGTKVVHSIILALAAFIMLCLPQAHWHEMFLFCFFFPQQNILFSSENSHSKGIKWELKSALRKLFSELNNNWQSYSSSMKTWQCKTVELPMGYLIHCKLGCLNYFLNSLSFFVGSAICWPAVQNYRESLS